MRILAKISVLGLVFAQQRTYTTFEGFETWSTLLQYNYPTGWFTSGLAALTGSSYAASNPSVAQTNQAFSGQWAILLRPDTPNVLQVPSAPPMDTLALAATGEFNISNGSLEIKGIPLSSLTQAPESLRFYYDFQPQVYGGVEDSAALICFLTKWNTATMKQDTIGFVNALFTNSGYYYRSHAPTMRLSLWGKTLSLPVTHAFKSSATYQEGRVNFTSYTNPSNPVQPSDPTPDSISIIIFGGCAPSLDFCSHQAFRGTHLYLDELSVSQQASSTSLPTATLNPRLYPQPASEYAVLQVGRAYDGHITRLIDPQGRIVTTQTVQEGRVVWSFSALPAGIYFYQIYTPQGHLLHSGKVQKL
ncbi:MAG: T9SS type A sorting domain-containing protein [Bacteroidia bacterium]